LGADIAAALRPLVFDVTGADRGEAVRRALVAVSWPGGGTPELLLAVAKVLTGAAEASSLDRFEAWRALDPP
jgi:hypothetical protein